VPLECKIPHNFDFEFSIIRSSHQDIRISPMKGIVPGRGKIDIDIEYTPRVPETTILEVELRIAQYRSEPVLVSITGCGRYMQKLESPKEKATASKKQEEEIAQKKKNEFRVRVGLKKNRSQVSEKPPTHLRRNNTPRATSKPMAAEDETPTRER